MKPLPELNAWSARVPFKSVYEEGYFCKSLEEFVHFSHHCAPLGQRIQIRNTPSGVLSDTIERGIVQVQFAATEMLLRGRQAEWQVAQEVKKNQQLQQTMEDLKNQLAQAEVEKENMSVELGGPCLRAVMAEVEVLKAEKLSLQAAVLDRDDAAQRAIRSVATLQLEKQKEIDALVRQQIEEQGRNTELLARLDGLQREQEKLMDQIKEATTARVKAGHEKDSMALAVRTLEERYGRLKHEYRWVISEGIRFLFSKLKKDPEYMQHMVDINSVMSMNGYQNGLKVGYKSAEAGVPIERALGYDPDARAKLEAAADRFNRFESSFLAKVSAMHDASFSDLKAAFFPVMFNLFVV